MYVIETTDRRGAIGYAQASRGFTSHSACFADKFRTVAKAEHAMGEFAKHNHAMTEMGKGWKLDLRVVPYPTEERATR